MAAVPPTRLTLLAVCAPGLEPDLTAELKELIADSKTYPAVGGVEVETGYAGLWTIIHRSRIVEEVRVRIGHFIAPDFVSLEAGLKKVMLHPYYARDVRPEIRVTSRKSRLIHTGAIAERVERWFAGQKRVRDDAEAPRLHVRLDHDRVTLSVDAAPDGLHRRGWRTMVGVAPLRETIAAGCLRAAGLATAARVVDPFCGSGTLLIEAALAAGGDLANRRADLPFTRWPAHPGEAYAEWLAAQLPLNPRPAPELVGRDNDPKLLEAAAANTAAAGCTDAIRYEQFDSNKLGDQAPSAIITNIPWGERLDPGKVGALYKRLGETLRKYKGLDPVFVLGPEKGFVEATGSRWEAVRTINNRGTHVVLWRLERA